MGLLYLPSSERNPATTAMNQFIVTPAFEESEEEPAINEQLFLIDLALSQIELGGEGGRSRDQSQHQGCLGQGSNRNSEHAGQNPKSGSPQAMALRASARGSSRKSKTTLPSA